MSVIITSDSTCDLGVIAAERDVRVIPLGVLLGEKEYKDGVDIVPQDIFDHVAATGELPKTSAPSIEAYKAFFRAQMKSADDRVVHVNISEKASGSHRMALSAAKEIGEDKVFVVDSKALSTGQGLVVLAAADLRDAGKSAEEVALGAKKAAERAQTSFVVDTLEYLHKGGRCSLISLLGAKVLKIHPYIDMKEGQLVVKKKYKGSMGRCFASYADDLAAFYPEYDDTRCIITHSHCDPALVKEVREKVEKLFRFREIHETVAGSVITSHCGQGTLGVLFLKKEEEGEK